MNVKCCPGVGWWGRQNGLKGGERGVEECGGYKAPFWLVIVISSLWHCIASIAMFYFIEP